MCARAGDKLIFESLTSIYIAESIKGSIFCPIQPSRFFLLQVFVLFLLQNNIPRVLYEQTGAGQVEVKWLRAHVIMIRWSNKTVNNTKWTSESECMSEKTEQESERKRVWAIIYFWHCGKSTKARAIKLNTPQHITI